MNKPLTNHSWSECVPALVDAETGVYNPHDAINTAVRTIFATELSDTERKLFHQQHCLLRTSDDSNAVNHHISELLRAAGALD